MIATLIPLADHGNVVSAIPFVAPMVLIVAALAFLVIRDRVRRPDAQLSESDSNASRAADRR